MSPSFSFIKPVSPRKAKKSKSQPISPFAHQPFRAALSPITFRAALSRSSPRKQHTRKSHTQSGIPKATYPKRQYRRETIASQQKAGYAIATINDGLLPTGS
jgi:hypothetical protein